jgi:hypothetical protein
MSDHDNNAYETRKVGVAFPPFVPEDVRTFATPELVVPEPVLPTRLQKLLAWLRIKQLPEQPVYEVPVYDTPQAVLRARMHKDDAEGPFYLVNLSNNCENLDKRYGFAEILIQLLQPTQYDGWGNSNRAILRSTRLGIRWISLRTFRACAATTILQVRWTKDLLR